MKLLPLNRLKTYSLRFALLVLAFQMGMRKGQSARSDVFEPVDATDMVSLTNGDLHMYCPY